MSLFDRIPWPTRESVGHDTVDDLAARMRQRGEDDGAVRLPDDKTTDLGAPPTEIAKYAAKVRIGTANQQMLQGLISLARNVAKTSHLVERAKAQAVLITARIDSAAKRLHLVRVDLVPLKQRAGELAEEIALLPFYARGLIRDGRIVVFVLASVGTFDGAVIYAFLGQTNFNALTIWLTTIGAAFGFAAVNDPLGRLLAAIVEAVPDRSKVKLAAATLTAGLLALLTTVVMLGVFRHVAAAEQNHQLQDIAAGKSTSLAVSIDPSWLAPLQAALCISAIVAVALWRLGQPGRDLREKEQRAQGQAADKEAEAGRVEALIDQWKGEREKAVLAIYDIAANGAADEAEIALRIDGFKALVITETAWGEELAALYRAERNYYDAMFKNGGVWRMALPTRPTIFNRPKTPAPEHGASDEDTIRRRHKQRWPRARRSNGRPDHQVDPDDFSTYSTD